MQGLLSGRNWSESEGADPSDSVYKLLVVSTEKLVIWIVGGAFWQCYSTKKLSLGLVGGTCQLFCSTEKSIESIVGGINQLFCSTEKLL